MAEEDYPAPAPCRVAKRLLAIAVGTALLAGSVTGTDLILRSHHQGRRAALWMQALNLSAPALRAAGTPLRHPETVHPAVDLRFLAGLESPP